MSYLKTLFYDSLIYGLSGVLTRFITLFLTPLYTRVFTPSDYGILGLLGNGYALVMIFVVLALDNSTSRWFYDTENIQERKITINTWLWFYLLSSLLAGIIIYFLSDYIEAKLLDGYPNSSLYVKILAITLPMMVWYAVATNVLRFERKAIPTVALSLTQNLLIVGLNILFVLVMKYGLKGIYYAQLITALVTMPFAIISIRKWIGFPSLLDFDRLKQMIRYSLPFVPASLAFWIVNLSGVFFVNAYMSKADVGLYQIGVAIAAVAGLATNAFQQAWSPFAFSIMNKENAKHVYARVLYVYVLIVGLLCMLISLYTPEALFILTTPKYYGAAWVASILVFSYLFIGLTYISDIGSSIAKKTAPLGFINTVSAGCLVLLNMVLVPAFGKEGAALSVFMAQSIIPFYMFYRSQKYYYIPYNFKKVTITGLIIISAALLGKIIFLENYWFLLLAKTSLMIGTVGLLCYFNRGELKKAYALVRMR